MNQSTTQNRRWVLASRPHGAPVAENFRTEEQPIPTPAEGQVLLRTVWLSLDPYMRGRMSDAPSYSPPVEIGAVMVGGTVSRVETSRHPDYKEGEWVLGYSGWQEYELSDGQGLVKLGEKPSHPSWALGVLGMPGFTAYMGLLDIGQPQAGKPSSWRRPRGRLAQRWGRSEKSKGAGSSAWLAGRRNAVMRSTCSVSTPVWITMRMILPNSWRKPARRALTCIMKTSAVKSLTPCCRS